MAFMVRKKLTAPDPARALKVLDTLRDPVVLLDPDDYIAFSNLEAEYFFSSYQGQLAKSKIQDFVDLGKRFPTRSSCVQSFKQVVVLLNRFC